MEEKSLLKIAIICSMIGIAALYIISDNISIDEKTIDKISSSNIGENVKLIGNIDRVSDADNVVFLEISQPSKITVILFKDKKSIGLNESIDLHKGDYVEIIGKVDEYEGEREVIAHRIRVVE